MEKQTLVWAHRGASGYAPENTLEAFQKAVEMGADGVTRYTLVGGMDKHMADGEDDYTWLRRGYATMTVLTYDLTHDAATKALEDLI